MKLSFNRQQNYTLMRLAYEGSEWPALQRKYEEAGFTKSLMPYVLNEQNEELECYIHRSDTHLKRIFSTDVYWRSFDGLDTLKHDLIYEGKINISFLRVVPEDTANRHVLYLFTNFSFVPFFYKKLSEIIAMTKKELHVVGVRND